MITTKDLGKALLTWNCEHLVANGELTTEIVAERFHSNFIVIANGRQYETDLEGYLQFLNGFRQTISAINYDVLHEITEDHKTVLSIRATVHRINGTVDQFEAMLLLAFNDHQKITLWHEVYVELR